MQNHLLKRFIALILSVLVLAGPALSGPIHSETPAHDGLAPQHRKAIVYLGLGGVIMGSIVVGALLPSVLYEVFKGGLKSRSLPKIVKSVANKNGISVISGVVGNITGLGVVFMGAPIWEPLQANVKRKTFQFIEGSESQALSTGVSLSASDFSKELDRQWKDMQSHFSMNGQWNRDVYFHMLMGLEQSLQRTETLVQKEKTKQALEMLALVLYRHRTVFPEIPFTQSLVVATARINFPSACLVLDLPGSQTVVSMATSLAGKEKSLEFEQVLQAWFLCD